MAEWVLTRTADDRRLYACAGIGTLRLTRWPARRGTAEAAGRRWEIARHGVWKPVIEATDAAGASAGELQGRVRGGGVGVLRWSGREFELRREGWWVPRYALFEDDRVVAAIVGRAYGRSPVTVTVDDAEPSDPGFVLFLAFVVRALAMDSAVAAVL